MTTKTVITKMLKENTGVALCDSGGVYGRHWQKNQIKIFEKEEHTTLEFEIWDNGEWYIDKLIFNLYHWLINRLEYDSRLQTRFNRFANRKDQKDNGWLNIMEDFTDYIGGEEKLVVNTYNGEDLLSQVIQYVHFEIDNEYYILLQIHNGCDIRGGYTSPKAFKVVGDDYCMFENATVTLYCKNGHNWYSDDVGNNLWYDGCMNNDNKLNNCLAIGLDKPPIPSYTQKNLGGEDQLSSYQYHGNLVICRGKGYCPICGEELEAATY